MGRRKHFSEEMGDLIEALGEFREAESTIKAKYLALAEQEISEKRDRVLDMMFVKHRASGPSEIANTTGISRSTVIRWRKEWESKLPEFPNEGLLFAPLSDAEIAENDALIESGDFTEEEVYGVGGKANQRVNHELLFTKARDPESNADMHAITNEGTGETVYVIWGDTFAVGHDVESAKVVDRPDWITDTVLQKAEEVLGFRVPGATWR